MTRVLAAIVGIPLVVGAILAGGLLFEVVLGLSAGLAAWEAFRMLRSRGHHPAAPLGVVMAAVLACAPALGHGGEWWRGTLVIGCMVAAIWLLRTSRSDAGFLDWVLTLGIALYAGGLLSSLLYLRLLHNGLRLVLLVVVLTWAYDTGAYLAGRSFGTRPFMRQISSSKTWEGVAGGLVLTLAAALVGGVPARMGLPTATILGVAVAVAAQAGDLLESLMKRYAGVKDSGALIPGHGGLLDRIDSLLFTGSAAYFVLAAVSYR